jgi:predicted RNase H-like HicB family nuclease
MMECSCKTIITILDYMICYFSVNSAKRGVLVMIEYTVIYEWAGNNYSAYVPDLPGCIACGDTFEDTQHLIKEAIELYIETLREDGKPVPEPSTKAGPIAVAI